MIPLVTQVVTYLDLFSMAIRNTVGRFVAIHFNRQEDEQSNIYFNTALFSVITICLLLCIPVVIITALLTLIFNIPEGHEADARWLFFLVTLSSFLVAITSPFLVSTLIRHRFDLSNSVRILSKLFRVVILVLCFKYLSVSLKYVGWSYCGMASLTLISSMWLTIRLTPQLRIGWKSFRWYAFRQMVGMSSWMTINQVGTLLYLSTDLIIINIFLGPKQCGRYGPLVLLVSLLSMLGTAISNVFTPIAYEYIAQKQEDALARHAKRSTKFMGLIIALPIGLFCGFSTPVLTQWLGTSFADLSPLMWLLVGPCIINITVRPLFSIYRGMNKVKVPAIVILAGGITNVLLSILLVKYTGLGLYGVALASVFCLTSKNLLFTPIYVAHQLGQSKHAFFEGMVPATVMAILLSLAGLGLSRIYDLSSLARLCIAAVPLVIVYLLICYWAAINKEDRRFLLSVLRRR